MNRFIALLFAASVCLITGCASRGGGAGDNATTSSGSGITVFGTIDANVSGSKNR